MAILHWKLGLLCDKALSFNLLQKNNILKLFKFKELKIEGKKLNVLQNGKDFRERTGNTVGKGKMQITSIFAISHNTFESFLFPGCLLTHSHTMTPFDAPGKQAV